MRTVAYAELSSHHAPCDGVGERWGPNCNAAIHRYCSAHGFVSEKTGGKLDPVTGTAAAVTAMAVESLKSSPSDDLASAAKDAASDVADAASDAADTVTDAASDAADAVECLLTEGLAATQQRFNS